MLNRYALTLTSSFVFMFLVMTTACGPRTGTERSRGSGFPTSPSSQTQASPQPLPLKSLSNFTASSERITIMTWNMENLFDTVDDPKTDDEAYLPLSVKAEIPGFKEECEKKGAVSWVQQCLYWDWNDDVLKIKLERLGAVIRSVNDGKGPDILVVQEVENLAVLERLIETQLADLGYTAHLIENNDYRGIDVGVITRLKPAKAPGLVDLRSRPGLALRFDLGEEQILNLIGVHFPISPTPIKKRLAMLQSLAEMARANNPELTIVAGDFNFPSDIEKANRITTDHLQPNWIVSHLYVPQYQGTFYDDYSSSWSNLDMILLSPGFVDAKTKWTFDPKSIHIHKPLDFQNTYNGLPSDFNLPNLKGVSDHWPLVMQIVKTN